jgi:serine/threonine-protein kinase
MAVVYLAHDDEGTPFVVKRILESRLGDADSRDLFLREARVCARLVHPHIVRVFELIEEGGELALVMEYLEGLSLQQVARDAWRGERALPIEPLAQALAECALGLHHAHQPENGGVVHRDVSPDNLILTREGVTKLIDFGVAKPDAGEDLTQGEHIRGKPSYMAPEQVVGEKLDGRADLFALGVSFYYLLTGTKPFKRKHWTDSLRAVVEHTPRRITDVNPKVPPDLARVVHQLLEKDRDRRTSTGAEVASQLGALLRTLPRELVPAGRLLHTVHEAERNLSRRRPEFAALPSIDWSAGKRLKKQVYDDTAVVDPDAPLPALGQTAAVPVLGALSLLVDDESEAPEPTPAARPAPDPGAVTRVERPSGAVPRTEPTSEPAFSGEDDVTQTISARSDTDVVRRAEATLITPPSSVTETVQRDRAPPANATRGSALGLPLAVGGGAFALALAVGVAVLALSSDHAPAPPPVTEHKPLPAEEPPPAVEPPPLGTPPLGTPPPLDEPAPGEEPPPQDEPPPPDALPPQDAPPAVVESPPVVEPTAARAVSAPTLTVERKGPARLHWRRGKGKSVGKGSGRSRVPVGTTWLTASDPRRGSVHRVPIVDGVADYGALGSTTLRVQARPWARVQLGKEDLGITPVKLEGVVPGSYKIKLEWESTKKTERLIVKAGKPAVLKVDMRK